MLIHVFFYFGNLFKDDAEASWVEAAQFRNFPWLEVSVFIMTIVSPFYATTFSKKAGGEQSGSSDWSE